MGLSIDREKVIKELESLRDICNAKSNMAIGNGKVAWAGYANTADDAIVLLKEQEEMPLRCKKCGYHREDGLCSMHRIYVKDTDYCSLGMWKGQ